MAERTVEDRLRQEYFELLPVIRRVANHLETEVSYSILPVSLTLDAYEQLVVTSRIKECESAVGALRRRQEGGTFDSSQPDLYTLTDLNDLAGVRVLASPRSRLREAGEALREQFPAWEPDPVPGLTPDEEPLAYKYHGHCGASSRVRGEFQVVPMLTGLLWEVEHSAIYKPAPSLRGIVYHHRMERPTQEVYRALREFEEAFEQSIRTDGLGIRKANDSAD